MTNIALRLPEKITRRLDQIASELGQSRNSIMVELLDKATRRVDGLSPDLNLGTIRLVGGETNDAECPECGGPMLAAHIGFTAGVYKPQIFGPVCDGCARHGCE